MPNTTLLDIAKLKGSRKVVGLIEEVQDAAPEFSVVPARTINGTSYPTVIRTGLPTVAFRDANGGVVTSKSKFSTKTVETFILDSAIEVDKAVADAHEDGAANLQAIEAAGVTRAAMLQLGKQFYYGRGPKGDKKGFHGLQDFVSDKMTVDAEGSTENGATSVYAVKFGPQFVQLVFGQGSVLNLDPFTAQQVQDANGGKFSAYVSNLTAWVGLQCVNENAVGRICNITDQAGKTMSDALLAELIAEFPVGYLPDAIFMNRRARKQLQKSRTVVLQGNGKSGSVGGAAGTVAPTPTEYEGIPIVCTDSLVNDEPIVSNS